LTNAARHAGAAAALWALTVALSPGPALARKRPPRPPRAAGRPEDDVRLKGDAKAFARAKVRFVEPSDEAELPVREEGVRVSFSVQGYALGPAMGASPGAPAPHAHLIVDNAVALTVYDAIRPVFIRGIKPGPHSLRIVLCRSWHEVVKAPGAFALTRFWVGPSPEGKRGRDAEHLAWPDPKQPILTYVLPLSVPPPGAPELAPLEPDGAGAAPDPANAAGSATAQAHDAADPPAASPGPGSVSAAGGERRHGRAAGGAKAPPRAVLDFYLSGAKLVRRGYRVRLVIDKKEYPTLRAWKPLRLDRLRPGLHRITIDLLDRRGNKVRDLQGRTDRTFSL
jgi:hypothetical protein